MSITVSLSSLQELLVGTLGSSLVAVVATVALVRLYGLRSLAKFAPHDFVVTVALGSVIAATAARSVPLPTGVVGLGGLFLVQWLLSRSRRFGGTALIDNDPLLLMAGEQVLWENMDTGGVTVDDLRAKLRESNVVRVEEVRAVVLEGTGDISVLHVRGDTALDPVLVDGVRGTDEVDQPGTWRRAGDHRPFERR